MPGRLSLSERTVDLLVAAAVLGFAVIATIVQFGDEGASASPLAIAAAVVAAAALLVRRDRPLPVLAVVMVCRLYMTWDIGNEMALGPAAAVSLYTVARTGDRKARLLIATGAALFTMVVVAALDDDAFVHEALGEAAQMLLPVAVADAARSRADRLRDLIDAEADARVQAERIRIARDLHDVVAHGLSTIAVQSGVAAHLLDRSPGQAKEALDIINRTGKQSLEELRSMVGVLRSTDEAPLRPTPSVPDDLSELVANAADFGLDVSVAVDGRFPEDVADSCVVALHRIAQEALTNVARHGAVQAAEVVVEHRANDVRLTVRNQLGHPRAEKGRSANETKKTGVGILGMTERAEALGGTLLVGVDDETFTVTADIPYHRRT